MSSRDYDLLVIGAGSGGVRAARMSAGYGARVAIVESSRVGGTCVIRGCVPKKLLVYGSRYALHLSDMAGYGWTVEGASFDWAKLIEAKDREIQRLEGVYRSVLRSNNVELIEGAGRLVDPHTVQVGDRTITADRILIAVGGRPFLPDVPGVEHAITSTEALDLPELPKRIVIAGAGYIALEFAGIFRALGVDVTLVVRKERPLRGFDEDIRDAMSRSLATRGIKVLSRTEITSITPQDDGSYAVSFNTGSQTVADQVMFATGRVPNIAGLGLEELGIALTPSGAIQVDEWNRTNVESVFAIGDVTGRIQLTPVAINEGAAFAETFYNNNPRTVDYSLVAHAVFSQPCIGAIGLTEAEARARGPVRIFRTAFRPMLNTLAGRDEQVVMKLVVCAETDKVLGCHMMGSDAPEILQPLAIALRCGATKADFDSTIAVHPTSAEELVLMRNPVE
ncbi:glutathione-disulfide reductase [Phaeovibrio sulfidiphilus]|uniref:Glutathione reductase n=1 Tax=Phaeovibrio sulfidiphilus TaxID=1220600 RepID=A0A8J6Z148_9PROT|nr:glutathione-disulfide reductase [Phaeovibrio sulfidiphilus]MBE1237823.1 glutathione-disulfide reductase [Phaeovibrio sulfidiphilus]